MCPVAPSIINPQPSEAARPLTDTDQTFTVGSDVMIVSNRTLSLLCVVLGTPLPEVTWQSPSGLRLQPGQSADSGRISVSDDGTLVIRRVAESDEGSYSCTASSFAATTTRSSAVSVKSKKQASQTPKIKDNLFF